MHNENIFVPTIVEKGQLQTRTIEEIKEEPMLWSADIEFAAANGGPITQEFVSHLDTDKNWIIDTRVHMLMEGWYPCIGGWHLDNMPRNTENGQPNYKNPPFISMNTLGIIDAGTNSLTEFLTTPVTLPDPEPNEKIYGRWSKEINKQLEEGEIQSRIIPSETLIEFDTFTFHRGRPATDSGWRMFIRALTDTPQKPHNEIRKQVNTYLPVEAGW